MFNYAVLTVNKVSAVLSISICFKFFKIKGIFVPDNTCSISDWKCFPVLVGYMQQHLQQWAEEHKSMFHFIGQHSECEPFSCARGSYIPPNIIHLKRVQNKFDCHNYDIFLINELGSSLNVQSDSIHVKTHHFYLKCT